MVLPSYMKEWLSEMQCLSPSIYFYVYGVLTICMCIRCMPCPQRLGMASHPLGMELQMGIRHHVGLRAWDLEPGVFKRAQCP